MCGFLETSAKTGTNIKKAMRLLMKNIVPLLPAMGLGAGYNENEDENSPTSKLDSSFGDFLAQ